MCKFKKGDWALENDAKPGEDVRHCGYRIHDVLPDGQYVVEISDNNYALKSESYLNDCVVEPRCTGWDWVLPEPSNRFGLKVGDTVTIKPHDSRDGYVSTSHIIVAIEDTYHDGIARFRLDDTRSSCWHPYYFGLCQSDGSPLPEKPTTKKILLEEWCCLQRGTATFDWQEVGNRACVSVNWFKTGVTRELEVPNEE